MIIDIVCGEFMVSPKRPVCLFNTSANNALHLTRSTSARGEPRVSGDRMTVPLVLHYPPGRRILMNNAGSTLNNFESLLKNNSSGRIRITSMIKKTKNRYRRFRHHNLAHHPNLFQTLDFAMEGVKFLALAAFLVTIFYLV